MNTIKKLTYVPTTDKYILSKINTNIVTYEELRKYKNINDLFKNDSAIILYTNPTSRIGHWVCLVRRNNIISYFDSYGKLPDDKRYLKGRYPYLSRLLLNSKYILEYNEYNYQKNGVSTCGHHCIVRVLFKYKPLKAYQKFMSGFKNDDEVVTAISEFL